MALTEKQLEERRHYIGGTDVAIVLGKNKYKTPLDLYFEKITGKIEQVENPYIENGNDGEIKNRRKFAEITGLRVKEVNSTKFHKEYPFLAANIDGLVFDGGSEETQKQDVESPIAILEIKNVGYRARKDWGIPVPIPELKMAEKYQQAYNEYGFEQKPGYVQDAYLCQAILYAAIYELPIVYFAVDFGFDQYLCTYKYARDIELENMIIQRLVNFWKNHVEKEIPPEPKNDDDIKRLWKTADQDSIIVATPEIEELCYKKYSLKKQIDQLEKESETLELQIKKYMQKHDTLLDSSGNKLITWNNVNYKGKFDSAKFKHENEELYNLYIGKQFTQRRFCTKIKG